MKREDSSFAVCFIVVSINVVIIAVVICKDTLKESTDD